MATWNGAIAASSDDARQNGSVMNLTGTGINISATTHHGGFRFVTDIPALSTISSAILNVAVSAAADSPDVTASVENADSAATYSTSSNDITGRTYTGSVAWTGTNIGAGRYDLPDLASPVQTVVNRAGFTGPIAIKLTGNSSGEGVTIVTIDNGTSAEATLAVTYTPPGGVPVKAIYYARLRRDG